MSGDTCAGGIGVAARRGLTRRWARLLVAAFVAVGAVACGASDATPDAAATPVQPRLPECVPPTPPGPVEVGPKVPLLDEMIPTSSRTSGSMHQVSGWIARTPREVRAAYENLPGLTLVTSEDEVFEAELLFGAGDRRVYVKANSVCEGGSIMELWSSPEEGEVPVPKGGDANGPA